MHPADLRISAATITVRKARGVADDAVLVHGRLFGVASGRRRGEWANDYWPLLDKDLFALMARGAGLTVRTLTVWVEP